MPEDAQILHFGNQYDRPTIWVSVDPSRLPQPRVFLTFGTGHEIPEDPLYKYIGTATFKEGMYIWHLYEEI